jgi:hypothetical protein
MRCLTTIAEDAEDGAADRAVADAALTLPATGRGAAYLRVRVAEERHARERQSGKARLVRDVYEKLASHAHVSRLDDRPEDRQGISAAFLVPCDRMTAFRAIVGDVADANPDLALLCTGPWPAYSFVGAGSDATNHGETRHAS